MKILSVFLFSILFSSICFAASPADLEVKEYVESHIDDVYYVASISLNSDQVFFDDNMECFSSYSLRPEVGVCTVSGSNQSDPNINSTYLIIIKEESPGATGGPLEFQIIETSRIVNI